MEFVDNGSISSKERENTLKYERDSVSLSNATDHFGRNDASPSGRA